jgi:hypothetical protein
MIDPFIRHESEATPGMVKETTGEAYALQNSLSPTLPRKRS